MKGIRLPPMDSPHKWPIVREEFTRLLALSWNQGESLVSLYNMVIVLSVFWAVSNNGKISIKLFIESIHWKTAFVVCASLSRPSYLYNGNHCCRWSHRGITMTSLWARWRLKSLVFRLFTQPCVQVQIKENIKVPRHWPLWGDFNSNRWIPRTKDQ